MQSRRVSLVTCSYGPDRIRCGQLCESVARFVSAEIGHVLIVPQRDLPQFESLIDNRTKLISVESLLPRWIKRVPAIKKWWVTPYSPPVRGWILQQIVKLSTPLLVDADVLTFVDSDVTFIRPFEPSHVVADNGVRLHRIPGLGKGPKHGRWNRAASRLLDVQPKDYHGFDYIGQLVSWKRENVLQLHQHIEKISGRDWRRVLCNTLHFSEYVLYGVFVECVLGDKAGHYSDQSDLCHCSWHYQIETQRDLTQFLAELRPEHVAILLQSYLPLDPDHLRPMIEGIGNQVVLPEKHLI